MSVLEEYLINRIKKYTTLVIIQGEIQTGKSTFTYWLCNRLHKKLYKEEWNYEKYCARSLDEFIDIIDKSNNKIVVYEEASKDITIQRWYNDLNLFFNIIMQTQGYKHNIIFLVFPHSASVPKQQRYFINLGIEVIQKIDQPLLKATIFKPTIYKRRFYKLDENDLYYKYWCRQSFVKYTKKELAKAREYTEWLEGTLKKDVMKDIKQKLKRSKMTKEEKIKEDIGLNLDIKENVKPIKVKDPFFK
jgi:hypothetical protein